MQDLGLAETILPGALLRVTIRALYDFAMALRERGPVVEEEFAEALTRHPLANVHAFAGFDQIRRWEEEFLPAEEIAKYRDSVGYRPSRD